MGGSTTLAA